MRISDWSSDVCSSDLFSVLSADDAGRLLLQKRAPEKYHSAGLWTNACCSHPLRSEDTVSAAHRRLQEELGFDCGLNFAFKFIYRAKLDKGLIEHELDHVFTGRYNGHDRPDPSEISEITWYNPKELHARRQQRPEDYTN